MSVKMMRCAVEFSNWMRCQQDAERMTFLIMKVVLMITIILDLSAEALLFLGAHCEGIRFHNLKSNGSIEE